MGVGQEMCQELFLVDFYQKRAFNRFHRCGTGFGFDQGHLAKIIAFSFSTKLNVFLGDGNFAGKNDIHRFSDVIFFKQRLAWFQ